MDLLAMASGEPSSEEDRPPRCSRKGCSFPGTWRLLWNNPRIHPPERRKVWLACKEHRDWLEGYLRERSLWKETLPLGEPGADTARADATEGPSPASPASGTEAL